MLLCSLQANKQSVPDLYTQCSTNQKDHLSECVYMDSFGLLFNTLQDLIEPVMTVKIIKRVERMNG